MAQTVKRLPAIQETQLQFLGQEDPLEKETAIHSSTLAWKIPWMEEPDRLWSMGSQRVGHDWMTLLSFTFLSREVYTDSPDQITPPFMLPYHPILLPHCIIPVVVKQFCDNQFNFCPPCILTPRVAETVVTCISSTHRVALYMHACVLSHFSCVWLFATPWTVAC